jgi:hypothetical protein
MKTSIILSILFYSFSLQSQSLFDSEKVMKLEIRGDIKKLKNDRGDQRSDHELTLVHKGKSFIVSAKVRGNYRRKAENCGFPPLMIDFDKDKMKKSVFRGINKLKVVTHCRSQEYILKEYLTYKLYNLYTDTSFKVRLCEINYVDTVNNSSNTSYAFFIENDEEIGERLGLKIMDSISVKPISLDTFALVRLSLFQYMIGNTDWMISKQHNIKICRGNEKLPIAIAYDFDFCGLVNTKYAAPHPSLEIKSVKNRLFKGIGYDAKYFKPYINKLNLIKNQIAELYNTFLLIDVEDKRDAIKYLDEFYEVINDEIKMDKEIYSKKKKYGFQ